MLDANNFAAQMPVDQEGVSLEVDALSLNLSEDDIAHAIGNRVNFAKTWWNQQENLKTVQIRAEDVWLNLCSQDVDLYDYQDPYKENLIFTNIETLISQVLGRPPQPMVTEAQDTDASRDLARNLEKVLLALYHNGYQRAMLEMIARHLLTGFRYGVAKYKWDNTIGRKKKDGTRSGGIVVNAVRPDKIIFDAGATDKDNIPLIAEYMQASHEDLCNRYPSKASEIMMELGKSYGTASPMTDLVTYLEVHFTGWRPDNGDEYEGIAWKLNNIVLDSMKNPNYNYDEFKTSEKGELEYTNYFEKPKKPYVVFNYLNQGKYIVDSTSLTDQTRDLQRSLEKRGRQIDENADMANAGTIYNSMMVDEEVVSKLVGDPGEKIMAKGDVDKAAKRLPINTLEEYIVQDKIDIRTALNNIWGVNNPLKGEASGNPTLGQDQLSVQRNTSRLGTLSTALENGMDRVYKAEIQLFKVFATEVDLVKYNGTEGHTEFINFSNENIESGIGFTIKEGTLLPDDPATKLQEIQPYAPLLDALTLAERLASNDDDPKIMAKRIWLAKADPGKFAEEFLGIPQQGNHDPDAVNSIQQISQGQTPPVPQSPSANYVNQLNSHMASPAFGQMNPIAQEQLRQHAKATVANARKALGTKPSSNPQAPALPPPKPQGILGKFGSAVKNTLFK